jgi:hypothetical protein
VEHPTIVVDILEYYSGNSPLVARELVFEFFVGGVRQVCTPFWRLSGNRS